MPSCYQAAVDPTCGGIALFVGTVRNHNKGEDVVALEFSSYEPMAVAELTRIAEEARQQFGLRKIVVEHALGRVEVEGIAVIIAVSSVHRAAAFEGCQYIIDELKKRVPIWKKEFLTNGEYWVNARP